MWNTLFTIIKKTVSPIVDLSFTPEALITSLWLEGDIGGTPSNWEDQSLNNNDAIQVTTSNQPSFGNSLNSLSVASFSTNDYMKTSAINRSELNGVIAFKLNSIGSNQIVFSSFESLDGITLQIQDDGEINLFWYHDSSNATSIRTGSTNLSTGQWYIVSWFIDNDGTHSLRLNGEEVDSSSSNGDIHSTSNSFGIGARNVDSTPERFLDGDISEIVFTPSATNINDLEALEGWIAHKRNLTSVLSAEHPYKNISPIINTTLENGLVGYYKFEESSGNFKSSFLNGYDLEIQGSIDRVSGKTGQGLGGCSNSNYLIPSDSAIALNELEKGSFEISFWVYLENSSSVYDFVGKWRNSISEQCYLIGQSSGDTIRLYTDDGSHVYDIVGAPIPSFNAEYFVQAYYDADAGEIGISLNNGAFNTTSVSGVNQDLGRKPGIGYRRDGTNGSPWSSGMWMDELVISNRVRTPEERDALYNSGLGLSYPGVDRDIEQYFNLLSGSYTQAEKDAFKHFAKALKARQTTESISMWESLDVLVINCMGNDSDGVVNLMSPGTYDGNANGGLTFTARKGFEGDGSTGYIDSNYPVDGSDPIVMGIYLQKDMSVVDGYWIGADNGSSGSSPYLRIRMTGGGDVEYRGKTSTNTGVNFSSTGFNEKGSHTVGQSGTSMYGVQNQITHGSTNENANSFSSPQNVQVLRGTGGYHYSAQEVSAYWISDGIYWSQEDTKFFHAELEKLLRSLGASVDPDVDAYMTALSGTYTDKEVNAISNFIIGLKQVGVWDTLDRLHLFALDTEADALIDAVSATSKGTNNGMIFTAREGLQGDGASAYYSLDYTPSVDANNYTVNSATVALYINKVPTPDTDMADLSARSFNGDDATSIRFNSGTVASLHTLNDTTVNAGIYVDKLTGTQVTTRTGSLSVKAYTDGVLKGTLTDGSTGLPSEDFTLGAGNTGGSYINFTDKQFSALAIGSLWNGQQARDFHIELRKVLDVLAENK